MIQGSHIAISSGTKIHKAEIEVATILHVNRGKKAGTFGGTGLVVKHNTSLNRLFTSLYPTEYPLL